MLDAFDQPRFDRIEDDYLEPPEPREQPDDEFLDDEMEDKQ